MEGTAFPGPFATQSKNVSRYSGEAAAAPPGPEYPSRNLSEQQLSQQSSSHWMEEYNEAPLLLTSGRVAQRATAAEKEAGASSPWQATSALEKLPSPKELCHRRKKGSQRKSLQDVRALSVLYHLEELKRRQNKIDELKKAQWGGVCVPQQSCDGGDKAAVRLKTPTCHEDPQSPFAMLAPPQLFNRQPVFSGYQDAQLLYPEWSPTAREQRAFSQESPVLSFTMATQERHPTAAVASAATAARGYLSEEEFWGYKLQSEE